MQIQINETVAYAIATEMNWSKDEVVIAIFSIIDDIQKKSEKRGKPIYKTVRRFPGSTYSLGISLGCDVIDVRESAPSYIIDDLALLRARLHAHLLEKAMLNSLVNKTDLE